MSIVWKQGARQQLGNDQTTEGARQQLEQEQEKEQEQEQGLRAEPGEQHPSPRHLGLSGH